MMNCLQWFKWLVVDKPFDKLQEEFKAYAKMNCGYFLPKHPNYDINDESVFYVDIEQDGNMTSAVSTFSFSQFVEMRIDDEYKKTILCIRELKKGDVQNDTIDSLKSELNSLLYLNSTSNVLEKREKIKIALENIVNYIKDEMFTTTQINESETVLIETIFGFKGKLTEIRPLYDSFENLGFFNPDNNQYESFHQILTIPTSTKVVNLQTSITVSCDNYKAAYILSKIEPLFSRLNFRSIDKSRLIKNRLGNPFTESSLSKAKTIFRQRAEIDNTLKDEIDRELNPLINRR